MALHEDVEVRHGKDAVSVYYRGELVGELQRVLGNGSRRLLYADGDRKYDNLGVAARELVRRMLGVQHG